jgi:hypothetical protein
MPVGDKAIQEVHIPNYILQGAFKIKTAYFSEMIPEDGCFSEKASNNRGVFEWSRNRVLFDKRKMSKYGLNQLITQEEVELIRVNGKKRVRFSNTFVTELSWKALEDLSRTNDCKVSRTARTLIRVIWDNPNSLIEDEIALAQSLGIRLTRNITKINLFEKTERVSVQWTVSTSRNKDTIRLGFIAPPNCLRKSTKFTNWLKRQPAERIQVSIRDICPSLDVPTINKIIQP